MQRRKEKKEHECGKAQKDEGITIMEAFEKIPPFQFRREDEPEAERTRQNRNQAEPEGFQSSGKVRFSRQSGPFFHASIRFRRGKFKEESIKPLTVEQFDRMGITV
jgi:hypothetical protein